MDSGLILAPSTSPANACPLFQSLFQWIPVLYDLEDIQKIKEENVSILISVDSGLILGSICDIPRKKVKFQSLFQWIPVLYDEGFVAMRSDKTGFNPYFSGFRSYTLVQIDNQEAVKLSFNPYFSGFRSYTSPRLTAQYPTGYRFNPYFSGFRSYTLTSHASPLNTPIVSILISVDSGLIRYIKKIIIRKIHVSILISVDSGLIRSGSD